MIVTIHTDKLGRHVAVIPDVVAAELRSYQDQGWFEQDGAAIGWSKSFPAGSRPAVLAAEYFTALAATDLSGADQRYAFTVGASGWDVPAQWWTPTWQQHRVMQLVQHPDGSVYFTG